MSSFHDSCLDSEDESVTNHSDSTSAYESEDCLLVSDFDDDPDVAGCTDRLLGADPIRSKRAGGNERETRSRTRRAVSTIQALAGKMCYRGTWQQCPTGPLDLDRDPDALGSGDHLSLMGVGRRLDSELSGATDIQSLDALGSRVSSLRLLVDGFGERLSIRRLQLANKDSVVAHRPNSGQKSPPYSLLPKSPVTSPTWSEFPPSRAKRAPRNISTKRIDFEVFD